MENPGMVTSLRLTTTRKGLVVGGALGLLITVAAQVLVRATATWHEDLIAFLFGAIWMGTMIPTCALYHIIGWEWKVGSEYDITAGMFCLMLVTNSFILSVFGGAVGYLLGFFRKDAR